MRLPPMSAAAVPTVVTLILWVGLRIFYEFIAMDQSKLGQQGMRTAIGALMMIIPLSITNLFAAWGSNAVTGLLERVRLPEFTALFVIAAATFAGALLIAGFIDDAFTMLGGLDVRETNSFWYIAFANTFGCLVVAVMGGSKAGE